MLTGPVTIIAWSFVRDDIPIAEVAYQIGLCSGWLSQTLALKNTLSVIYILNNLKYIPCNNHYSRIY